MLMARRCALALVLGALLIISFAPSVSAGVIYDSGLRKIDAGDYYIVKGFKALDDAGMSYSMSVQYGPNIDILLLESEQFEAYKRGDSFSYMPMSRLNVRVSGFVESNPGELVSGRVYYLLIDNSDKPVGGASPSNPEDEVMVDFEMGGGNVESVAVGSNFMLLFVLIGAGVIVVVIVVLFFIFKGVKTKGGMTKGYPTGQKFCPRCGTVAPPEYSFCPKCGNRL
ncbi:MAG: hypothetical protein QW520_02915 [Methanomassiliicoccales archaeon]